MSSTTLKSTQAEFLRLNRTLTAYVHRYKDLPTYVEYFHCRSQLPAIFARDDIEYIIIAYNGDFIWRTYV